EYYCGAATRLQDRHDVLDEVEVVVGGGDGEVGPLRGLVGALGAEGRIGQDHVVALRPRLFVNGVARADLRLQAVEEEVHEREAAWSCNEVLAEVGGLLYPLRQL